MEDTVNMGVVGCGFMGARHIYGFSELYRREAGPVRLVSVCDLKEERANRVADLAKTRLGRRPAVYKDFKQMLSEEGELDAVDIVVDPPFHHILADQAFRAGKHVIVEKPMAVTVRACQKMVDSARKHGRILAVAENFRRDPSNRLVKMALDEKLIGKPYMILQNLVEGGGRIAVSPWRHKKEMGGILIDMGVHYADLFRFFFGDVESVHGELRLFEEARKGTEVTGWPSEARAGMGENAVEAIEPTAEDTAIAIMEFENGVLGQWTISLAGHGKSLWQRIIYGSRGRIDAPLDRSGKPISITLDDGSHMSGRDILEVSKRFPYEDLTRKIFPEGLSLYDLSFQEADRRLIAIELSDFAEALIQGREPEVDGTEGLKAVALSYAVCESAYHCGPVKVKDVENGRIAEYQREIDKTWNIE